MKIFWICLFMLLASWNAMSTEIKLKHGHPTRYTVKPGDTLWGISAKFLADPLQWPELLEANPEITEPGLIFPGQVLELHVHNGIPKLHVVTGGTVKLSPKIQSTPVSSAIPTIPLEVIRPFLNDNRVIGKGGLKNAPFIVTQEKQRFISGLGNRIYALGIPNNTPNTVYAIVRPGRAYLDPYTQEFLGYAADDIGKAELVIKGSPATLVISQSRKEIISGDKLIPINGEEFLQDYVPHIPKKKIKGNIIDALDGVTQIGQYQIVAINRGHRENLKVGDILAVYTKGKTVSDPRSEFSNKTIKLPDERSGVLMVFRVYSKVSYGIIMYATRTIHLLDVVESPNYSTNNTGETENISLSSLE